MYLHIYQKGGSMEKPQVVLEKIIREQGAKLHEALGLFNKLLEEHNDPNRLSLDMDPKKGLSITNELSMLILNEFQEHLANTGFMENRSKRTVSAFQDIYRAHSFKRTVNEAEEILRNYFIARLMVQQAATQQFSPSAPPPIPARPVRQQKAAPQQAVRQQAPAFPMPSSYEEAMRHTAVPQQPKVVQFSPKPSVSQHKVAAQQQTKIETFDEVVLTREVAIINKTPNLKRKLRLDMAKEEAEQIFVKAADYAEKLSGSGNSDSEEECDRLLHASTVLMSYFDAKKKGTAQLILARRPILAY